MKKMFLLSFKVNDYKHCLTLLMQPHYTRDQVVERFKEMNPVAEEIVIESSSIVEVE